MEIKHKISVQNILFCPEQHIVAVGEYGIHVLDSINIVEIENYPLEYQVCAMMFSKDGNKIYAISENGQIYVVDRIKKKVISGDKVGRQRMFHDPGLYDESLVMPLLNSQGFVLVVQGEQFGHFINDWYYVDDFGNVKNYFSISDENSMGYKNVKRNCNATMILNDPYRDGCYYFTKLPVCSILCFDPDKMEFKTVCSISDGRSVEYISKKDNYMICEDGDLLMSELPNNPNLKFEELHPRKIGDTIFVLDNYVKTSRNLRLASSKRSQYFDIEQMKAVDIPKKYFPDNPTKNEVHPRDNCADVLDMDNIRVVYVHYCDIFFYDSRTGEKFMKCSPRNLK